MPASPPTGTRRGCPRRRLPGTAHLPTGGLCAVGAGDRRARVNTALEASPVDGPVASRMLSLQPPILVGTGRARKRTTESPGLAVAGRVGGYGEMAGQRAVFGSECWRGLRRPVAGPVEETDPTAGDSGIPWSARSSCWQARASAAAKNGAPWMMTIREACSIFLHQDALSRKLGPETIKGYAAALRSLSRWADENGLLPSALL